MLFRSRGGGNNPDFNRGGNNNGGNRGNNNFNPQAEIRKKNEELLDKIAAMLKPEQQPVVKKLKYDQIKARGGVERLRGIMEQEGTPLTQDQITQIQSLFNASNQSVRTYAQGLVQQEVQALSPGALQLAAQQGAAQQNQQNQQNQNQNFNRGNNNNNNVNNVNQNQVAQQIIGKLLPEVSKRHAVLDKTTMDAIQARVFTPAQVASYKLSSQ